MFDVTNGLNIEQGISNDEVGWADSLPMRIVVSVFDRFLHSLCSAEMTAAHCHSERSAVEESIKKSLSRTGGLKDAGGCGVNLQTQIDKRHPYAQRHLAPPESTISIPAVISHESGEKRRIYTVSS